ncbi:MAG: GNAT family N-acetyltransferase [Jatrophihabitantaceae bacterium]
MAGHRSRYRSAGLLTGLIVLGWLWDVALGGGRAHSAAWLGALVVVGGISLLAAHGAADENSPGLASSDPTPSNPVRSAAPATGPIVIQPATAAELPHLIDVEVAADTLFEVAGYGSTPGPASLDELASARLLLVARPHPAGPQPAGPQPTGPQPSEPTLTGPAASHLPETSDQEPIGYIRIEVVDGQPHIEGLSVRPRQMRRGVGTALVNAACQWAAEQGFSQLTLCTFADVPWNGPFYARLGFTEIPASTLELQALREREARLGLDAMGRRCVMRRPLGQPLGAGEPPLADLPTS